MRIAALASIAVLALLSPWHASRPETITLYRCAGPGASVSFQDAPCGPGREQQTIEMERPQPPPEPAPAPEPPAPADPLATPEPSPAEAAPPPTPALRPPPRLWRCRGLDKEPYFSETATPPPRCLPLAAMGYDTSRLPPQMQGACQNVYDECVPLIGRDLCQGWDALLDDAKAELRRAFSNTQAERQAEVARLEGIIRGSGCR